LNSCHSRELGEPKTQLELMEIAKFFQGRQIDGNKVFGAAIFTERGSEGITMGATGSLYAWGFQSENTPGSYDMEGVQDFWQEPVYAELLLAMQKRLHDYVVADKGTAKEALDLLIEDWTEVFEDEGKL
jgi:hypothetical protein